MLSVVGRKTMLAAAGGFVAGLVAMRLVAGHVLIPAAEEVARAEVRAEFPAEAARAVVEAARESREIEREIGNASDSDLRGTRC